MRYVPWFGNGSKHCSCAQVKFHSELFTRKLISTYSVSPISHFLESASYANKVMGLWCLAPAWLNWHSLRRPHEQNPQVKSAMFCYPQTSRGPLKPMLPPKDTPTNQHGLTTFSFLVCFIETHWDRLREADWLVRFRARGSRNSDRTRGRSRILAFGRSRMSKSRSRVFSASEIPNVSRTSLARWFKSVLEVSCVAKSFSALDFAEFYDVLLGKAILIGRSPVGNCRVGSFNLIHHEKPSKSELEEGWKTKCEVLLPHLSEVIASLCQDDEVPCGLSVGLAGLFSGLGHLVSITINPISWR